LNKMLPEYYLKANIGSDEIDDFFTLVTVLYHTAVAKSCIPNMSKLASPANFAIAGFSSTKTDGKKTC